MSTPTGDNAFLQELEVMVSTELTVAESCDPEAEPGGVPAADWLPDPDAERYEIRLRNLLGAVEALETAPAQATIYRPGCRSGRRES